MQLELIKDIVLNHCLPIWVNVIVVVTLRLKRQFMKHVGSYLL